MTQKAMGWWRMFKVVLIVLAVWLVGDLFYSQVVSYRYRHWERKIERNASGVRTGHEAFAIGKGESAILMVHGFADSPKSWRPMATALADKGYTCRVMRLEGFAEPVEALKEVTIEDWLAAIEREAAELERSHTNVWLVGHSTGASLVMRYILDNPDRHPGMVLMAPLLKVANDRSPLLTPRAWFEIADHLLLFTDTVENVMPPDMHTVDGIDVASRDRFFPNSVYRNLYQLIDSLEGRAAQFSCPTLLIVAANDHVIDVETAHDYVQAFSGPHDEITLTNSFHVIHIDDDWREATRQTARFIQSHTPH